jgi:hypothetical protein
MNASSPVTRRATSHWGWITGWGVCPEVFAQTAAAVWPRHRHTVLAPAPDAAATLATLDCDVLAGYSLGALLLLAQPVPSVLPLLAIAPILAFDAEASRGGKTPARLRSALAAKLDRDPRAATNLYLRLVSLSDLHRLSPLPSTAELAWGLEALRSLAARPASLARAGLFLGDADPLVDSAHLLREAPHSRILSGLDHDFRKLLPAVSRLFPDA